MFKPIRLALERTLALILTLLLPASGRRRRPGRCGPAYAAPRTRTPSGLRLFIRRTAVSGLGEALLGNAHATTRNDASGPLHDTGPLVRPYLLAHERRQRQEERRAALVLALEGIDIGPWVIHGHRIGTPVTSAPLGVAA